MFSTGCGIVSSSASGGPEKAAKVKATRWTAPAAKPAAPTSSASPSRKPATPVPSAQQLVSAAVGPLVSADNDDAGMAVLDLTTGQWASCGGNREFITASIAKADILATLLYQAQQAHGSLSAAEQDLATVMIEDSDNNAADSLYNDAGGASGVDAANKVFGLRDTTAGYGVKWGLTTTTANDQVRLLRQIFTTPSELSASSQAYIQRLMRHVTPEQAWGVPVVADSGTGFAVKNGWLPAPKLWAVNSVGSVTHNGHHLLIAVLSHYNYSYGGGISVVEGIAKKAANAVTAYKQTSATPGQS
jgi:beta-lactamase class A